MLKSEDKVADSASVKRNRSLSASFKGLFRSTSSTNNSTINIKGGHPNKIETQTKRTANPDNSILSKLTASKEHELHTSRNRSAVTSPMSANADNTVSPVQSPKLSGKHGVRTVGKMTLSRAGSMNSQESFTSDYIIEEEDDEEENLGDHQRRQRISKRESRKDSTSPVGIDGLISLDARLESRSSQESTESVENKKCSNNNSTGQIFNRSRSRRNSVKANSSNARRSLSLKKVNSFSSINSANNTNSSIMSSPKPPYIRGRAHADTISATTLPTSRNVSEKDKEELKCILQVESFKVFENGSHEHNLKMLSLVSGNVDTDKVKSPTGNNLFSFSGIFKNHSKADEANADYQITPNKYENAKSLIPPKRILACKTTDKVDKYRSRSRSNGSTSSDDDEEEDGKIPEVVNSKAAVSSPELKLINKLSEKIHNHLQIKTVTINNNTTLDTSGENEIPAFSDLYGKSIGHIGHGAYGVVSVCARPIKYTDIPPLQAFTKEGKIFFAVKELKPRSTDQVEKFSSKITSEFIIGHSLSTSHTSLNNNGTMVKTSPPPNILKIFDLMENNDSFIEVMEFCPSGDLYSLLTRKSKGGTALHPVEADCFMKQLLHGVKFMHDHGVAHCDLKPENILFHPNGLLKICDFGTSCVFQTAWEKHVHFQSGAMGSEPYVAPEEFIQDKKYDPRLVDLWSIGVVYCTMVLGHYLWKIAVKEKDALYASFVEEITEDKQFYVFEDLRHVNHEINRLRRIALYKIFQWNPQKRITVEELLHGPWMKHTRCCVSYRNSDILPVYEEKRRIGMNK
ncbi:hypothetical protein KAFR_0F01790 [Kazachstania africana CBS 2517]|uniref:Protein kinase domain-containing protein n=1 Tax=Kazachstania africana (strain ATCC 22294 / BCRC 22015 / CBS 2517 / CECT 1963 / NBRC 1671 / NRRL Y-8276) TaxID=1071382 RepID=H2AWM6_KAZAF|nr:hypothetical protein KAFR_0F01790 [Kazachstania africana CBS 2517]CCF58776.1 hypothetical protein KAFR_0F01790 [Kazachstania africana CBS 2517]